MLPSILSLIVLFLLAGRAQLQDQGQHKLDKDKQDSFKVVISEGCVAKGEAAAGGQEGTEMDLVLGSPLVLTHKINLLPSGSCGCENHLAALRERLESLEKEVSDLREKCGGAEGACCGSESKGAGCSIKSQTDQCPNECSDQGRCEDGKCICFPGFSGLDCSETNCPGNCNDKGRCVNGQCVCDPGFTGPDCSLASCPDNCNDKGRCVNGRCVCDSGFTGPTCADRSCPGNCNQRGRCVNGQCICSPGFVGPDCSQRACPDNCNNRGRCVNGKCECISGYTGADCSETACPGNCNNRGRCVNAECVCDDGFSGQDCSEIICPNDCSEQGECVRGRCECNSGFTGEDCSISSCPDNCNDRGQCVDGQCVCEDGFTGPDCSEQGCPDNCSNKGRCVNGRCVCNVGFSGQNCATQDCPNNCSKRGRCVKGRCLCRKGFIGKDCSQCQRGLTGPNCDTVMPGVSALRAEDVTDTSVTLVWTLPSVQYETYYINFINQEQTDQQMLAQVDGHLTTYAHSGLEPSQGYSVSIVGEINGRRGSESTAEFMTLMSGPTNLQVVKTTSTTAVVQWEPALGEIDSYQLTITPHDGTGTSRKMQINRGETAATILELEAGRLYDISLVARKGRSQSKPAMMQARPGKTVQMAEESLAIQEPGAPSAKIKPVMGQMVSRNNTRAPNIERIVGQRTRNLGLLRQNENRGVAKVERVVAPGLMTKVSKPAQAVVLTVEDSLREQDVGAGRTDRRDYTYPVGSSSIDSNVEKGLSSDSLSKLIKETFGSSNITTISVHMSNPRNLTAEAETIRRQIMGVLQPFPLSLPSSSLQPSVDSRSSSSLQANSISSSSSSSDRLISPGGKSKTGTEIVYPGNPPSRDKVVNIGDRLPPEQDDIRHSSLHYRSPHSSAYQNEKTNNSSTSSNQRQLGVSNAHNSPSSQSNESSPFLPYLPGSNGNKNLAATSNTSRAERGRMHMLSGRRRHPLRQPFQKMDRPNPVLPKVQNQKSPFNRDVNSGGLNLPLVPRGSFSFDSVPEAEGEEEVKTVISTYGDHSLTRLSQTATGFLSSPNAKFGPQLKNKTNMKHRHPEHRTVSTKSLILDSSIATISPKDELTNHGPLGRPENQPGHGSVSPQEEMDLRPNGHNTIRRAPTVNATLDVDGVSGMKKTINSFVHKGRIGSGNFPGGAIRRMPQDQRNNPESVVKDSEAGQSSEIAGDVSSSGLRREPLDYVGVTNHTSDGFTLEWDTPVGKYKNFLVSRTEVGGAEGAPKNDVKQVPTAQHPESNDRDSEDDKGVFQTHAGLDGENSNSRVFRKMLPDPARFLRFKDLVPQTEHTVTLLGMGPGILSSLHKLVISTGPEPPSNIVFSRVTENSLTVSWTKPKSPVSGFKVTYMQDKEGEPVSVTLRSGDSSLDLSQLSPGSSYEVNIISILDLDESDPIEGLVTTLPDPPTDLRAINVTDSGALLLWRPALAAISEYIIVYGSDSGSETRISVSGNAAEQQLSGLEESTTYTVTITSHLSGMESSPATTRFTTTSGRDTDGPHDLKATNVTPRTATVSWKAPSHPVGSYMLTYQTKGQEIKEMFVDKSVTSLNLTRLHPGSLYSVQLLATGGQFRNTISTQFTTGTLRFPYPTDCTQELLNGIYTSGEVEIFPQGKLGRPITVYCDMETDGGGWLVFQRRKDGSVDFFRGWKDYVEGFGDLNGEFWLGLGKIHNLTNMEPMTLRVDLRDGGESVFAKYSTFVVAKRNFRLTVGGYSGTAGDSLGSHDNRVFSTKDRDPAAFITSCALSYRGGWWYQNCHSANLNGLYGIDVKHQGLIWETWKGKEHSIQFTEMKMRPAAFRPALRN